MISDELVKESTKLEKYLIKQGRQELVDELKNLNAEQLKQRLLKQALHREETLDTRADDEKLKEAKAEVKGLNAPYNEQLRMNAKISRFINLLMKDK